MEVIVSDKTEQVISVLFKQNEPLAPFPVAICRREGFAPVCPH